MFPISVKRVVGGEWHVSVFNRSIQKAGLTLLDQSLVSLTNFLISLVLARYLLPSAYGIFVTLYAIFVLLTALYNSLVVVPMSTLGASLCHREAQIYFSSLTLLQILLLSVLGLLLVAIGLMIQRLTEADYLSSAFLAMAFALIFHLQQDYFRRVLYTQLDVRSALRNDILGYGLKIMGVALLIRTGRLSCSNAFVVIGLGSIIGSLYGIFQCRHLLRWRMLEIIGTFKENWGFGRWMLANALAQQASTQIYIYISAAFLSASMVGALGAARNLLGFTHIFLLGMDNLANPIASRRYMDIGKDGLNHFLKRLLLLGGLTMLGYCILVSLFSEPLLDILYKGQYSAYTSLVALFAIQYLLIFLVRIPSYGIRAIRRPRTLFFSNLTTAIISVALSVPLIKHIGLYGACLGMILTQVSLCIVLFFNYRRSTSEVLA